MHVHELNIFDALTHIAGYGAMLMKLNAFQSFLLCEPGTILSDSFALLYFPDKLAANVFARIFLFFFFLFLLLFVFVFVFLILFLFFLIVLLIIFIIVVVV